MIFFVTLITFLMNKNKFSDVWDKINIINKYEFFIASKLFVKWKYLVQLFKFILYLQRKQCKN